MTTGALVVEGALAPSGEQETPATALLTRDKQGREMVEMYMFVNREGVTANWSDQFWMLVRSRGRGEMACHFILNQVIPKDKTPEDSIETLREFAREMLPYVQQSLKT